MEVSIVCFVSREKKREMGNNLYTAEDYAGAINSYQRYNYYDKNDYSTISLSWIEYV